MHGRYCSFAVTLDHVTRQQGLLYVKYCMCVSANRKLCYKVRRLESQALPCFFLYPLLTPSLHFNPNLDLKPKIMQCHTNVTIFFPFAIPTWIAKKSNSHDSLPKILGFNIYNSSYLLVYKHNILVPFILLGLIIA